MTNMYNIRSLKSQSKNCYYCGYYIVFKEDLTVDHKLPISKGGKTNRKNLVVCCKGCNEEKGSMTEIEFFNYMKYKENLKYKYDYDELTNQMLKIKDIFKIIGRGSFKLIDSESGIHLHRKIRAIKIVRKFYALQMY